MKSKIIAVLLIAVIGGAGGFVAYKNLVSDKKDKEENKKTSHTSNIANDDNEKILEDNDEKETNKEKKEEPEVSEYTLAKTDLTQYLDKDISSIVSELGLVELNVPVKANDINYKGYYSKSELGSDFIIGDADGDGKVDYLEISMVLSSNEYRIYNLVYNEYTDKLVERIDYIGYKNVIENPTDMGAKGATFDYKYELNKGYNIFLDINPDRKELSRTVVMMK